MKSKLSMSATLILALLVGVGCRDREGGVQGGNSDSVATAAGGVTDDFQGTAGIVEKPSPDGMVAVLQDVRTARHPTLDRIAFQFEGEVLPGYHVEYVDRPVRQCGSGDVVSIAGDGWLEVRFEPAQAHTDEGKPTVKERERRLDYPNLKEVELTCDFEAHVTWVLGLSSPNRYRVLELKEPTRLVIDVKH